MIGRIASAAARRARRLLPSSPRPAILMYHRVAQDSFDPWGLAVAADRLAEQIRWLAKERTVLPLARFASMHRAGTLARDSVAVTFDDAYECTADVAAPLLESAGLPATIFIPAELIERGRPFWWDELQQFVLGHNGDRLELDGEPLPLGPKRSTDGNWRPGASPRTPRQKAFERIWALLRDKRPTELDEAMASLRTQVQCMETRSLAVPMTAAQVRTTASELIEFGSHALTHPWLSSLTDEEKRREIGDSITRVESLTGRRPTSFAYPYGNFDQASVRIVKEAGFACACATLGRTVGPDSGLFTLPRVQVGNWNARQLAQALAAA